jgi:hypothetical protein
VGEFGDSHITGQVRAYGGWRRIPGELRPD